MVDPRQRFLGQVILHERSHRRVEIVEYAPQVGVIVAVVDFVEARDGHHSGLEFLRQLRSGLHFVGVELVIAMEETDFDDRLNDALDQFG